jgi:uncharacterized membrane protein
MTALLIFLAIYQLFSLPIASALPSSFLQTKKTGILLYLGIDIMRRKSSAALQHLPQLLQMLHRQ